MQFDCKAEKTSIDFKYCGLKFLQDIIFDTFLTIKKVIKEFKMCLISKSFQK